LRHGANPSGGLRRTKGSDRLTAEGRADAQPIAPNNTAEGRARNRRIEVILVKESMG
jgi:type VI secretion system protein ImpK